MPVYAASSRSPQRVASDGSTNVYCSVCRELISRVTINMSNAVCALCARQEEGLPLDKEAIIAYEFGKAPYKDITMLAVQQEQEQEPAKKRRTIRSMGNGLLQAIGIKPKEDYRLPPSKQIALAKKVKPLFTEEELKK